MTINLTEADWGTLQGVLTAKLSRQVGPQEAEELAQDTLVKLLELAEKEEIKHPFSLGQKIAYRLLIDHWRRQSTQKKQMTSLESFLSETGEEGLLPSQLVNGLDPETAIIRVEEEDARILACGQLKADLSRLTRQDRSKEYQKARRLYQEAFAV